MSRIALLALAALLLSACDMVSAVKEGFQEVKAVETDLERSTGVKPQVGFNWHNGHFTSVTVAYPRLYEAKPLGELAELVRGAVARGFKQSPEAIVLSFTLAK